MGVLFDQAPTPLALIYANLFDDEEEIIPLA
jgi:hypothetical protein